jgi:hypothetical protein
LPQRASLLPYEVSLVDGQGSAVDVGHVKALDSGGGATIARSFARDLSAFDHVTVRDKTGGLVLSGRLQKNATVPAHSP